MGWYTCWDLSEGISTVFVNSGMASCQSDAVTWASSLISQHNMLAHDPHMFDHNVMEKSYYVSVASVPYSN